MPKLPSLSFRNLPSVLILRLLAVLVLFSISRLHFLLSNQDFFIVNPKEAFQIFWGGVRFDIVSVLYLNILFILIYILPGNLLKFAKIRIFTNVLFFMTNGIGILANCIDAVYYQFNLRRTTWSSLNELQDINNLNHLLISFLWRYWYVWGVWLVYLFMLFFIIKKIKIAKFFNNPHAHFDFSFIAIFFILAGLRGGDLRHATRPLGLNHAGEYVKQAYQTALVLNTPFTIFKTLGKQKIQRLTYFKSEKELDAQYTPVHIPDTTKAFKPLNVVIIIIESYSEEASGLLNKNKISGGFTPFLDSLRQKSFYSLNSFANGKKSIEALPALWCSIPSFAQPFVLSPFSTNTLNSLPSLLKAKNYHTSFFHGAPNGSMGFQSFANLVGVDHYYGKEEYGDNEDSDGIWGIWDEPFLSFYGKKLDAIPQPFFSTVFTLSSHDPFKIPKKHQGKFKKGPHPIYETLSYTDFALKAFFNKAKTKPWFKNTVFVITGDHTSSHATLPAFSNSIGRFRVPIFFYYPSGEIAKLSNKSFQQSDVMPTILSMLNYDKPYVAFGKNLLDYKPQNYAINYFGQYQWFDGKYVMQFDGEKPQGLYNFVDDKLLTNNILQSKTELANKMERNLKGFLQQYQNRMIDNRLTIK